MIQNKYIGLIMKYIFTINFVKNKNINTIRYKLSLIGTNPLVALFCIDEESTTE
jgi:hypothetical protein